MGEKFVFLTSGTTILRKTKIFVLVCRTHNCPIKILIKEQK